MIMNYTLRAAGVALTLIAGFVGSVFAGPFEDGVNAYESGDYRTALRLWRPLAGRGNTRAQLNLGTMYDDGRGVPQSYGAAFRWYQRAAALGNVKAQYNLGTLYYLGHGVPQNYITAATWFRKAANQGSAVAQSNLGTMYLVGHGVQRDYVIAYMWFNLAAVGGDELARRNRDMVEAKMTPAQIAEAHRLAREWKPN
jgi:uncharacterized protein